MTGASDHARVAYDAFAPYYDAFTAHHDYEAWTRALEALARQAGLTGRRLLDLGCGTGKSFLPFLARGYRVTACDISPAMLELARGKANGRARLVEADVRDLPVLGAFDLITFLDDAANYLDSAEELAAAFAGAARNLAPGGVLVFDANTLATFRRLYSSCLVVQSEGRVLTLRGRGSDRLSPGGAAVAHLDALTEQPDGWWSETCSVHRHRHHPEETVRAALDRAGLRCVAAHGLHVDGRIDPVADDLAHSKAVYVACAT
jgi:SAM-dependent methyltransferase